MRRIQRALLLVCASWYTIQNGMRGLDSRCVTSSMHHGTPFKWYAWSVWNAWCCILVHRAQQGDVVSLCRCRPYRVMEMVRWRKRRVMRAPERSLNNKNEEERGKGKEEEGVRVSNTHKAHITIHTAQQHNSTTAHTPQTYLVCPNTAMTGTGT